MVDQIIPDDSISGNKVHGGVISDFQSTGIQDLATQTSLVVTDGTATVDRIRTKTIDGNVQVKGNIDLAGTINVAENTTFQRDLTIRGNITANTITVANLIADVKQETREPITFVGLANTDANGKGLAWRSGTVNDSFLYNNGNIVSSASLNLAQGKMYKIAGTEVLSATELGQTVVSSNLRTVGRLGNLTVDGSTELNGPVKINRAAEIDGTLSVSGHITAKSITVDQLTTSDGASLEVGNYGANDEHGLDGQGLHWTYGATDNLLVYRAGGRLWSSMNIDLAEGKGFSIGNSPILDTNTLGPTVVKSNLRTLGTLQSLRVSGNTELAGFAFFGDSRVGIGTDNPNAALAVSENNVDLIIGSNDVNVGRIGTFSNDALEIVTDDVARIKITNTGEVNIGDPAFKNGVLRVNGKLYVDEVVADTRLLRSTSLQFQATSQDPIVGKGIEWIDNVRTRKLTFKENPERISSSENFDLEDGKTYSIDGSTVLSKTTLGPTVRESSLNKLGALDDLTVNGPSTFNGQVTFANIGLADANGNSLSLAGSNLNFGQNIIVKRQGTIEFTVDPTYITLGNGQNTNRPVRIHGRLGVGVNNPDPSLGLAVAGNMMFANKTFSTGDSAPTSGQHQKGDICWNTDPITSSYIGWVCVVSGTPGEWKPFGLIA